MPEPFSDSSAARDDLAARAPPVPGRGRPAVDIGLQHLQQSWVLRATAVLAFMGYGGLVALTLARKLDITQAAVVALFSLGSWFFVFWWFPVKERTLDSLGRDSRRQTIGGVVEAFAVGCVVLVQVMMAVIVVYSARR